MVEQTVAFKVFRYKQGQDTPHYDRFDVTVDEDTTVLVALQAIRRDQDPTLTLRHSCHHASCGTCAMRINGTEDLSCVVRVLDLDSSPVLVEPLRNIPLVSDLVVDMDDFYARVNPAGRPYVRHSEYLPAAKTPADLDHYSRFENCVECGACVSACPIMGSDQDYYGPAALAAAWRVVEEPRGHDPEAVLNWVDNEQGCWRCHVAYECTEVCPSGVDPGGKIMSLRGELGKQKLRRLFGFGRS
ncbi:MAG TPA: succinate dehydrogenase/fumarate reductase iron-sulfur subunit [Candidatus Binatia bacterium]|nr:succinate dehydrogenase/fumarate reductase iron-sulfur subunit [Candidatus Binatia bacterium]